MFVKRPFKLKKIGKKDFTAAVALRGEEHDFLFLYKYSTCTLTSCACDTGLRFSALLKDTMTKTKESLFKPNISNLH